MAQRKLLTFFQRLALDSLLLLIPLLVFITLFGTTPGPYEFSWWWPVTCGITLVICLVRAGFALTDLLPELRQQRYGWLLGFLPRIALLSFVFYLTAGALMLLLGAGVSVGEPLG